MILDKSGVKTDWHRASVAVMSPVVNGMKHCWSGFERMLDVSKVSGILPQMNIKFLPLNTTSGSCFRND